MGAWLLGAGDPLTAVGQAIEAVINVFGDAGDTRVLLFTLIIGALIATIEQLGGVRGFIALLQNRGWVTGAKRAQWLAFFTGVVVFIESNITLLIAGSISRPLFDRFAVSREKLAYIIDATSAPICVLIPLNAWGAVIVSLLASSGIDDPINVFIGSIAYNFYAIAAVLVCAFVIARGLDIGPMRKAQLRTLGGELLWPSATPMVDPAVMADQMAHQDSDAASTMLVPIVTLIITMPVALYVTGDGDISAGSGSTSVLWAVLLALTTVWVLGLVRRQTRIEELMQLFFKGAGGLLPVAMILLFSLALGDIANALGTGIYVAQLAQSAVPMAALLPLLFVLSAFIAFSIGSSWGTFAIMIPLAMQIVLALDVNASIFLAAVLSGAVFGDHASPISDTTVVASMAAATDHIDHVRTQLPYALLSAGIATLAFFAVGVLTL
jgi:Na+/H+ antiporter NhaC